MSFLDIASALVPKDCASRKIASDIAFGPDPRQKLDIYMPINASGGPFPVVIFFYGGAWSSGDRRHYGFAARALAAQGYLVVVPDYRLVPQIEYPAFLADCAAAVSWAHSHVARYGGDKTRLVLAGHSAGAYNAASLTLDKQWLPANVRQAIKGVIGLSGPYDFYPFDGPISRRVFGQANDPEATQPINHIGADAPPMLLISGGRDDLVLPRNSTNLGAALREVNIPAHVKIYPRLAHVETLLALSLPLRWIAPILADCADFLAETTSPALRPTATLPVQSSDA